MRREELEIYHGTEKWRRNRGLGNQENGQHDCRKLVELGFVLLPAAPTREENTAVV